MEALTQFNFFFPLLGEKMTINLKLKFKDKDIKKRKTVILPVYAFDRGNFIVILPIYENGELVDIIKLNLPIQVIVNPSAELYRYLRMRGVI